MYQPKPQKRRANNSGLGNENPKSIKQGYNANKSNFENENENEPIGPSWQSVQANMRKRNENEKREREEIISSLYQQMIKFQTKLNETIKLYKDVESIFRQADLQTNPHVIRFHTVDKERIIRFIGDMQFKLQHCNAIYNEVVKNTDTNYHALEKAVELLNPTELNVIFNYLENLDIHLIGIYLMRKREQRQKFQNTFRSPYKELANQRRREEERYLLKQGYPLGLIEAGVAEVSPSVNRYQLLPSPLQKPPNKPKLHTEPSTEYSDRFAKRQLFPNEDNHRLEVGLPVPENEHVAPPLFGLPFSENENDPNELELTQPATPGGKRKKGKKRSSKRA